MSRKRKRPTRPNHPSRLATPVAATSNAIPVDPVWLLLLRWAAVIVLLVVPWIHFSGLTYRATSAFTLLVWGSAGLALLLLVAAIRGNRQLPRSIYLTVVSGWLLVALLSTLASRVPSLSWWGPDGTWASGLVYDGAVSVLFLSLIHLNWSERQLRALFTVLSLQITYLAWATVAEAVRIGFPKNVVRPIGYLGNSDYLLSYFLLMVPVLVALVWQAWPERKQWWRLTVHSLQLILGMLALFLALPQPIQQRVVPFWHHSHSSTALSVPTTGDQTDSFLADTSNQERFTQWALGIDIWQQHRWLGSGPGTIQPAFFQYQKDHPPAGWDYASATVMSHPHNELIEQLATEGVVGALAYLLLWGGAFWLAWRNRTKIPPATRPYAVALAVGLLLYLGFNQALFTTVAVGTLAWGFLALLVVVTGTVQLRPVRRPLLPTVGYFLLVILLGTAAYYTARLFQAEQASTLAQAALAQPNTLYAEYYGEQAAAAFPFGAYYRWSAGHAAYLLYVDPPKDIELSNQNEVAQRAVNYLEAAVRSDPYNPQYLLDEGRARYLTGAAGSAQRQQGAQEMQAALALGSRYGFLYLQAGDAYAEAGQYATARSLFEEALAKGISDKASWKGAHDRIARAIELGHLQP